MATRSFIARQTEDARYEGVYCHWNGYPSYNGKLLHEHYSDAAKVRKLLSLGDISTLAESIGRKHKFKNRDTNSTTYYGRDRGETGVETKRYATLTELMEHANSMGCEYFYLFQKDGNGGVWFYAERGPQFFGMSDGSPFSKFKDLTLQVIEADT